MEQRLQLLEKTAELAGGGHAAMTAALPLVHGAALRRAVSEQQQVYSLLLAEASRLLAAAGQRPPAANRSRLGSFFVLQVKAMGEQEDRALTALLLQGIHDSVVSLTGLLHALALPEDLPESILAKELLAAEERCYQAWKCFL
jgi:hypothetical protein